MVGKGKGRRLTDSERIDIIASLEDPSTQLSRAECARQYGVTPAAISKLMKVRHSVKKRYSDAGADAGGARDKRQRGGFSKNVPFEDKLFQWICSVRARKVPLLVAHVQQKAKLLAARHKMKDDFKASNGWYYRFCGRYGLTPNSVHAGTPAAALAPAPASAPIAAPVQAKRETTETTQWTRLKDTMGGFAPEFVYTVSEARLFYQMLPNVVDPARDRAAATGTGDVAVVGGAGGMIVPGKIPRVVVLVCSNGTGTHKIPLLVVGKEKAPPCLVAHVGAGMGTSYFSQREVWCDERTFQHWCERVFLPAIRQRTTQPVLLVAENPGGRLAEFQRENVKTVFLPLRTGSGEMSLTSQEYGAVGIRTDVSSSPQPQPLHGAVVRDLKGRYKVGLFQERLSFLEKSAEEKYRLIQRAGKKPVGSAGVALGRVPHILDAMSLLDEAWAATPPALIRSSWVKSHLANNTVFPPLDTYPEVSDDALVVELCSMMRNTKLVDDMNKLAKELRNWLHADADSSERMQQELLYDIQQLLQEEEDQQGTGQEVTGEQRQQSQQQPTVTAIMDATGLTSNFDSNSAELRAPDTQPSPEPVLDTEAIQSEKRKSVELALKALARAEEALDTADVAEVFGEEAAGQASESISRALRRLHRIQRGKQSALVAAAVSAAANGDSNDTTGGSLSAHEYFYGNGSLRGIP
ncbi:hypothetical protein PF002_g20151 [Phytophthora fragariae]|uniref:HTH CENPB-type domain-containing protein n=2 Tax=Phytophthora fragariae TaxID=53985 RepID=A0A6A3XUX9_9STRA|nr:hypothetical protein PF009_g19853 [Phytophthora fragariae]KAE9205985.1 hypothetical protein PF002_g20151 [Phytophthora fragariae]